MLLPNYSTKNRSRDKGERIIEGIISSHDLLKELSEIDYEEFLDELLYLDLVLPKRLRNSQVIDFQSLNAISGLLDHYLHIVNSRPGLRWSGSVVTSADSPYFARRGEWVQVDTTSGDVLVLLPDPTESINKRSHVNVLLVTDAPGYEVTVEAAGGAPINGVPSIDINCPNLNYSFQVNGPEYRIW